MLSVPFVCRHRETGTIGVAVSLESMIVNVPDSAPQKVLIFTVLWENEQRNISQVLADEISWESIPMMDEEEEEAEEEPSYDE